MRLFPISSSLDSSPSEQNNAEKCQAMLYLNVYDLTPINNYLYWFGLGIYHSGIEVHDMEYGFGAHEFSTSGVFEVEPRSCPGFIFRRSIPLGSTDMSRSEFRSFMEHLSNKYHGDTYHLISKNCNHFTDEVCQRLTGKSIPGWVNRLARVENGMESGSSSVTEDSDEEALDHHHLLTTPNSDVAFLKDKPVKLAKDVL
ncbi:PPPDE putative thiol peptidase family protein [Striga asiatica]|uniref:PPPDE putative thiol peptidase family protein n=1 Tax=Striga asiatica TaxID=4170 RepID=A0A5A7PR41_STRAF|nr:PPPDE putative thiol peptidase family protein [Striga asiatica]